MSCIYEASPKANTIKQWNPGSRIGMNRPAFTDPSGGAVVPLPEGGDKGEVGQYIFDKACRYDAADPHINCKAVFGPEWEWAEVRDNFDPWGHTDDEAGVWHYYCPAGSFFHKCTRTANTETSKHKCCIEGVHETRKNQTHAKTCPSSIRDYTKDGCYSAIYNHCKLLPNETNIRVWKAKAADPVCVNYVKQKPNTIPEGYFDILRKLCHTKNPSTLVKRLQEPACQIFWKNLGTGNVKDVHGTFVQRPSNYQQDVIDLEREKYCFLKKNAKSGYDNLIKVCDSESCHAENIPDNMRPVINCKTLCTKISVDKPELKPKCDVAWNHHCKKKKYNVFGSSDDEHKKLCPIYWDDDDIKLTKIGEFTKNAKQQKPDKCAFAALTQIQVREMRDKIPACWYGPQTRNELRHNVHVTAEGVMSNSRFCPQNTYNVCCQNIDIGEGVASKEINIEQNCPELKKQDPNTITDWDGYELPIPWLAPPFKPDPKCEEVPKPTGIICEDPEEYPDFTTWVDDMVKFDADEIESILNDNWDKKMAREKAERDALVAKIEASMADDPTMTRPPQIKRKKKQSFIEMILEFFRKLFGGGKKKSKKERQKEAEEDEVLLEEFTDIPKKNTIIAMLLLLFFVYIIYKIFSNKSVQQGIGLGVGMNIGDNIGDGLVYAGTKAYENSDAISNVGSNILSAAISAGKDIL